MHAPRLKFAETKTNSCEGDNRSTHANHIPGAGSSLRRKGSNGFGGPVMEESGALPAATRTSGLPFFGGSGRAGVDSLHLKVTIGVAYDLGRTSTDIDHDLRTRLWPQTEPGASDRVESLLPGG